ncbi:MAG: hypothetical protein IJV08_01140 [Bacteroidaceae bacterium]|nr:hypothetical protein [Bacteroidaceae bacterium]
MNENKRIAFNSIIIYIRLCVVSFITVILSRVVLDALGASDFGLYSVVGGIVLLLNVLNSSMASTTYRYLAYELGKGKKGNTNKIFNVSFIIHACFAASIILIGTPIGDYYIAHYLNVPDGSRADASFVFHLSILAAAINTMLVPFQGLLVAYEKFYANAIIDIVTNLLKLAVIILFIYSGTNRLRLYSLIMLGYTFISSIAYVGYCRWKHKDVVHCRFYNEKPLYKEMLSFSGWTLFGAVANVGKTQGSAVVINLFFGTLVNAAYAVAHQVEMFILMFARSLCAAAVPQTTKSYSAGNQERSIQLTSYVSKYTYILMALISFPVIIEMDFLLGIWLKEVPEGASTFCKLAVLCNLLGCLGEGIPNLVNASGHIKAYQIVVQGVLLAGLPVSFLCYWLGASKYAIAIVYCIINFFNSFVKLYMLHRVVRFDIMTFIQISHLRVLMMTIPLSLFYYLYIRYAHPTTTIGSIIGITLSVLFFIVVVFGLGLNQSERTKVTHFIVSKVHH